jgi:hypothetical protein
MELNKTLIMYVLQTSLLLVVDQARRRKVGAAQRPGFSLQFGARVLRHVSQLVCNGNAITSYLLQDSSRLVNNLNLYCRPTKNYKIIIG